jgi:hypothetical protein
MAPFDKPVLSRVEGLRTGSGSPRTVLLGSSPQTGGSTGSSRTVLLGSSPQTGGSTGSPRTVLLGSSPQTGGSTGSPRTVLLGSSPRTEFLAQSSLTGNMESQDRLWLATNGIFCSELVDRQHGISPRTDPAFSALPWPCDPQLLAAWMWRWQAPGGWRLNVQPAGLQSPVARNAIDCRLKDWRVALPHPAPGRKRIPTARRQRDFNFREAIREYTMDGSKRTGVRLLHGSQRMGGPAGDPNRTTGHGF